MAEPLPFDPLPAPVPPPASRPPPAPRPRWGATGLLVAFGVVLPAVTLGVEVATRMCTEALFDPLPSPVHVALVGLVPLAHALALWACQAPLARDRLRLAALASGAALAVSGLYTLVFLPLVPVGLFAVVLYGLGLLPLSPLLSFLSSLAVRRRLRRASVGRPVRMWPGALAAGVLFLAAEAPVAFTQLFLHQAATGEAAVQQQAIALLRTFGSEEVLRTACYTGQRRVSLVSFLVGGVGHEEARSVYFRVTGQPISARPPPSLASQVRFWDTDVASAHVGGGVPGLSLTDSAMAGSVDAEGALAYLEWTLQLATTEEAQAEARAQLQLPPGAVISRVTLFIDGEEREAAFAGTGEVREAYRQVVSSRRDPLLVTARGQDRVQLQAFPITRGHPMRVKVGLTVPLELEEEGRQATLLLPWLTERNFAVSDDFRHEVRLSSRALLAGPSHATRTAEKDGTTTLHARLADAELQPSTTRFALARVQAPAVQWTPDLQAPAAFRIEQRVEVRRPEAPVRLVLLLDGSQALAPVRAEVAEALRRLPPGLEVAVWVARNGVEELTGAVRTTPEVLSRLADRVASLDFEGGEDDAPALRRALEAAPVQGRSLVVWVHGPQPLSPLWDGPQARRWQERAPGLELLDVEVVPGPNASLDALPAAFPVRRLVRRGSLGEDLGRLFSRWGAPVPVAVRTRVALAGAPALSQEGRTSGHLARLWAREEVARLLATSRDWSKARALAARHQLVTEVTGAVVLERQEQYDAAGLTPVEPGSVPTVPEPETWALLAVAALVLGVALRRRQVAA